MNDLKKILNFSEMLHKLKEGYRVREISWSNDYYVFVSEEGLIFDSNRNLFSFDIDSDYNLDQMLNGQWEVVIDINEIKAKKWDIFCYCKGRGFCSGCYLFPDKNDVCTWDIVGSSRYKDPIKVIKAHKKIEHIINE